MPKRLADLFVGHAGYLSDKWEQYIAVYETELARFQAAGHPVDLLEIGVQNGGSLQLWSRYLPAGSRIVGIDIDANCGALGMPDNVRVLVGDASDPVALDRLLAGQTFDIVIDDGSHQSADVIASFQALFGRVNPGGLYVVEDMHCSYSPAHGGGYRAHDAAIEWFKRLVEAINLDHVTASEQATIGEALLLRRLNHSLARLAFYDSMVVVERLARPKTHPYRRVMVGEETPVTNPAAAIYDMEPGRIAAIGLAPALADRLSMVWTTRLAEAREDLARVEATARAEAAGAVAARETAERELAATREALTTSETQRIALRRDLERQRITLEARLRSIPAPEPLRQRIQELEATLGQRIYDLAEARVQLAQTQAQLAQTRIHTEGLADQIRYWQGVRDALMASTSWRVTAPLRGIKTLFGRHEAMPTPPSATASATPSEGAPPTQAPAMPPPQPDLAADVTFGPRFGETQPIRVLPVPRRLNRLTMVTDSISEGSLFGGVGTAIVLAAAMARQMGASLRLVTRTQVPDVGNFSVVARALGIVMPPEVDFAFAPLVGTDELEVYSGELFLTTSWWTTDAVRQVIAPSRIVYLLQEDERMYYAHGDERLRCAEVLADRSIRFVINSQLLFEHLTEGPEALPNIKARGVWFEPAFPAFQAAGRNPLPDGKRNFFFYARPNNLRNLYWRGLQAISESMEEGVLDAAEWQFHFAGRDLSEIELPGGVKPLLHQNLPWPDYIALIRTIDVGLSLMATPHPSYPPLDLAAAGAIVVTNRYGRKVSLDRYADSIICCDTSVAALKAGIAEALTRRPASGGDRIGRDWDTALAPVLAELLRG